MTRCFVVSVVVLAYLAGPIAPAVARDRDRDGLPDRWEKRFDLSTKHRSGKGDPDRDRLANGANTGCGSIRAGATPTGTGCATGRS